jgi:aryl-alcohol dehydrogenase-like predicted oxidoreductase
MQMRPFGTLGRASALTLGGGGIGNVWGTVERDEAIATVRAAVDAGITMLDVAPTYGPGEAELVVGEALDGAVPDDHRSATIVRGTPYKPRSGPGPRSPGSPSGAWAYASSRWRPPARWVAPCSSTACAS